jgi:hypothetical protein
MFIVQATVGIIINYDHYRFIVEATSPLKLCFLKYRLCCFDFYVFTLFLTFIVLCIEAWKGAKGKWYKSCLKAFNFFIHLQKLSHYIVIFQFSRGFQNRVSFCFFLWMKQHCKEHKFPSFTRFSDFYFNTPCRAIVF